MHIFLSMLAAAILPQKNPTFSYPSHIDSLEVSAVTVPVNDTTNVTVFEAADREWWSKQNTDDLISGQNKDSVYGLKLWPGAVGSISVLSSLAATRDSQSLAGLTVLELGCGNGCASIAAAQLGAAQVIATDISEQALRFTEIAARSAGFDSNRFHCQPFDVCGSCPLPDADIVLVSDLLYESTLARSVARRVVEADARDSCIIVSGDPARAARGDFLETLQQTSQRSTGEGWHFFGPSFSVRLDALKWKSKRVETAIWNQDFEARL